ncbi:unnamed protein product [Peronospora belbahrii]|uniref:Uncharacterized protein n=1 Tax=Peronospora belbahrii TaxID=622444 RepID=A0ABN8D363_9STRA|nr:unnamed protein product [Peronospora belbahrii]
MSCQMSTQSDGHCNPHYSVAMYGAPRDDREQLHEVLQRLQHEKGEHVSFETETRLESDKKEREMQSRIAALESKVAFVSEKLQNSERAKLRVMKEMEELHQKQLVESKRRDAERRLLASKRRKKRVF